MYCILFTTRKGCDARELLGSFEEPRLVSSQASRWEETSQSAAGGKKGGVIARRVNGEKTKRDYYPIQTATKKRTEDQAQWFGLFSFCQGIAIGRLWESVFYFA